MFVFFNGLFCVFVGVLKASVCVFQRPSRWNDKTCGLYKLIAPRFTRHCLRSLPLRAQSLMEDYTNSPLSLCFCAGQPVPLKRKINKYSLTGFTALFFSFHFHSYCYRNDSTMREMHLFVRGLPNFLPHISTLQIKNELRTIAQSLKIVNRLL